MDWHRLIWNTVGFLLLGLGIGCLTFLPLPLGFALAWLVFFVGQLIAKRFGLDQPCQYRDLQKPSN